MRKERKIINTNIRLNLCDEQDRQAWEYLQTMDRQKYKSYTKAVVAALNDYFAREYRNCLLYTYYHVEFEGADIYPQGFAAAFYRLQDFKGINMLADIGNGTMNIMYICLLYTSRCV